jgi:hypothetical protein
MTRRAAAGRRPPAGYFALHAMTPWIVGAGTELLCTRCQGAARAPIPRLDVAGYNGAVETFLREHKHCQEAA